MAVAGSGIGTLVLPLIAQPILDKYGWRWTMRIFGFIALCCMIPASLCIIRRTNVVRKRKFVGKAVVFTRTFLFLGPAIFFYSLGYNTCFFFFLSFSNLLRMQFPYSNHQLCGECAGQGHQVPASVAGSHRSRLHHRTHYPGLCS